MLTKYTEKDDIVTLHLINRAYESEKDLPEEFFQYLQEKTQNYSDTKREIIAYILENGHGTIEDIASGIGNIGIRTTRYHLNQLCNDNILLRQSEKQRDKNANYVFAKYSSI